MKRREFIGLIAGAGAWPVTARAQQKRMPVIGYLHFGKPDSLQNAFLQGLKDTGYVAGQNVAIEYRWAEGHFDRIPALVTDLVRRQVTVIVAGGGTALAAKAASFWISGSVRWRSTAMARRVPMVWRKWTSSSLKIRRRVV